VKEPKPPDCCEVCGNGTFEYIGKPDKEQSLLQDLLDWLKEDVEDIKWIIFVVVLFGAYLFLMGAAYSAFHYRNSSTMNLLFAISAAVFVWFFYNGLRG
jgi:hypothetical protein